MKKYNNPVGVKRYTGLLFVSPFIIGLFLFVLYPFGMSFYYGLTDYDGIREANYIGLKNYSYVITDKKFIDAVFVTLKYTITLVPMKLLFSLLTALMLKAEIKLIGLFRTVFYLPTILGSNLAVVIMWQFLFTSDGLVNQLLNSAGIASVSWYGDKTYSMGIIVLLRLWEFGSTMIIFLNALLEIPKEYYEAAKVDGCSGVRSFFNITLPMLKKVIILNLILQIIAAVQEFNAPYMITGGGPMKSTYTLGMLIYDEMFKFHNAGYANAVSWIMFLIIGLIAFAVYKITAVKGEES